MATIKVYRELAMLVQARTNCLDSGNREWRVKHEAKARLIVRDLLPSGSGFDNGTSLDFAASTPEKLIFRTSFHHMNDGGFYDGWTEHIVTVRPSLTSDFVLSISGRNRNEIKDYMHETFRDALAHELPSEILVAYSAQAAS